jgi:hypothetical protein
MASGTFVSAIERFSQSYSDPPLGYYGSLREWFGGELRRWESTLSHSCAGCHWGQPPSDAVPSSLRLPPDASAIYLRERPYLAPKPA